MRKSKKIGLHGENNTTNQKLSNSCSKYKDVLMKCQLDVYLVHSKIIGLKVIKTFRTYTTHADTKKYGA